MKAMLWRVIYAVLCVVIFVLIVPAFLQVVGFPMTGDVWALIRLCIGCIAVIYVVFGPPPPAPF